MEQTIFNRLVASVEEMVAIEKGQIDVPQQRSYTVTIPNVKNQIRNSKTNTMWGK